MAFREPRLALLTLIAAAAPLTGCSLDFDQFAETATPDPDMFVPGDAQPDMMQIIDAEVDAQPDMAPLDTDGDGHIDDADNCPAVANPDQLDLDADGEGDACDADDDADEVLDEADNCPLVANPSQIDLDGDTLGDDCDDDDDGDGVIDAQEAALGSDPRRADTDTDGLLDGEDPCPTMADLVGLDTDGDGKGDVCDFDDDADGVLDWADNCPWTANPDQADACAADIDGDGVPNDADTCPYMGNPDQAITPCTSPFAPITYVRDARSLGWSDGQLVAGTYGGAVWVSDDDYGVMTNADGLLGNRIRGVAVDDAQRRWFASNRGVTVARPDGLVIGVPTLAGDGPQGTLRDVAVDARGTLWVASDDGLWGQNAAGWNQTGDGVLPSVDVRALHIDGTGRVWVATASGVVRIVEGMFQPAIANLPDIGALVNVTSDGDDIWLLGENGAIQLGPDDAVIGSYTGFQANDLSPANRGDRYLATADGVRRVDRDGRLLPAGSALLPHTDARAVSGTADAPRWVATAGGLVQLDGHFAVIDADSGLPGPCATTTRRIGDQLWIGTPTGLQAMASDGTVSAVADGQLPAGQVHVISPLADGNVWVGTDAGIAVISTDGTFVEAFTGAEGIPASPINDIVDGANGDIWVSSAGSGIARRSAAGAWQIYNTASVNVGGVTRFLFDEVRALAFDGSALYVASVQGISIFDQAQQNFIAPVTNVGGQLRSPNVRDLAVGGGRVFAATELGVSVRDLNGAWINWYRDVGGLPLGTGTDSTLSVAYDGTHLWAVTARSGQKPYGTLVRRVAEAALGDGNMLFDAEGAGLAASVGNRGVNLTYGGGELFLSHCGDDGEPGAITVLDGSQAVTRDLRAMGIPGGGGVDVALSHSPTGAVMFSALAGPTPTLLALSPDGARTQIEVPPALENLPASCEAAPDGDGYWCVLKGASGVASRDGNDRWSFVQDVGAFRDVVPRDLVVEAARKVWVATDNGVVLLDGNQLRRLDTIRSQGGLPDNDVRAVALGDDLRMYAGTAGGVGIYTDSANEWETLGAEQLPVVDVLSLAVSADNTLWIGTRGGLFKVASDRTVVSFGVGNGLPSAVVQALGIAPDGRILVGTDAGLAIGDGTGAFVAYGFAHGLPGQAVHEIVTGSAGDVWVRSDDGIARVTLP